MKIYLAGLPPEASKQALYGFLSRYMQIEELQMDRSPSRRTSATVTIQATSAEGIGSPVGLQVCTGRAVL